MLNGYNLVVDTMSEVYEQLRPFRTHEFWDFASHDPVPHSIYVLGRQQLIDNREKFRNMAVDPNYIMVFGNSAEGSWTLISQIEILEIADLVKQGRVLVISGSELNTDYPSVSYEHFLTRVLDYSENHREIARAADIFTKKQKPYDFLFLNGRVRPHRKYLMERFRLDGLLDRAVWTFLDNRVSRPRNLVLMQGDRDLMATTSEIRLLPKQYEVDMFDTQQVTTVHAGRSFVKNQLFNNQWGEIYLKADPYIDTYFSVVTETVYQYPHYSFRTEKIAKPLAIGHPWIVAATPGFYRDMHDLGFQTFGTLIDESFDTIDNDQTRMDRVCDVVRDLCQQDLDSFLSSAESICKYNQQHLAELAPRLKNEFADRFFQFVQQQCKI